MELRIARKIFNLDKPENLEEINVTFKRLVKKYHPDKIMDYSVWANERMSEVNDAYETLLNWFKNLNKKNENTKEETNNEKFHQKEQESYSDSQKASNNQYVYELTVEEKHYIDTCFSVFLEGLATYYQYGLQKAVYRSEGVRRFRFRESTRIIKRACEDIDKLFKESDKSKNPVFLTVSDYMQYTLADISLGKPVFPQQEKYKIQDALLESARKMFDEAVREIFFPELVEPHLLGRASTRLYSCYPIFVYFCMTFIHSERGEAGKLMLERHHALTDLMEMKKKGIFLFP